MNTNALLRHVLKALEVAKATEEKLGKESVKETGTRGYGGDKSIKADVAVEKSIIDYFQRQKLPFQIVSEEAGLKRIGRPEYSVIIDPIDGSDNYKSRREILPYSTTIAVFDSLKPKYRDVLIGATLEHHSNTVWYAVRGRGCFIRNKKGRCGVSTRKALNEGTFCIVNSNHHDNFEVFKRIFKNCHLRDFGSTALHYALLAEGSIDAYFDAYNHQNELPAGYLLINEAGGFVTDLKGRDIADLNHEFRKRIGVVCASTRELLKEILSGI